MKTFLTPDRLKRHLGFSLALSTILLPARLDAADDTRRTGQPASLLDRVGPPSETVLDEFRKAGMQEVRVHTLTEREYTRMRAALEALPPLHRDALKSHLHRLSFVDGIPGEGTGLTSPSGDVGEFDMTFRASIIEESLSNFLTTKEARVFVRDEHRKAVALTGTGTDALTYVLLHESAHILDSACNIVSSFPNPFDEGLWTDSHTLTSALSETPVAQTYFRGKPPLSIGQASAVYTSLVASPFLSLYSTASAREDFAELVAWREMQMKYGSTLRVALQVGGKNSQKLWFPLASALVRARFRQVDEMEAATHGCPVLSISVVAQH